MANVKLVPKNRSLNFDLGDLIHVGIIPTTKGYCEATSLDKGQEVVATIDFRGEKLSTSRKSVKIEKEDAPCVLFIQFADNTGKLKHGQTILVESKSILEHAVKFEGSLIISNNPLN